MASSKLVYYGSRISDNKVKTPEGHLVCLGVPIARTGWQEYGAEEIGVDGNGIVNVYRDPVEVFAPATIASFEGKDVTDQHPSSMIDPSNFSNYVRGHVQNIRRGEGADSDYLVGDLFIKDAGLISKVEGGQREVSCGYACDYEPLEGEGKYTQKNIRGNHVAVVPNGRAGSQIAIRDSLPENKIEAVEIPLERKEKKAMKVSLRHLIGMGLKSFAQDAEPEEVARAAEMVAKEEGREEKDCRGRRCGIGTLGREAKTSHL